MTQTTTAETPNFIDLIGVPYKTNGRSKKGFDCYGLAIEVLNRYGKHLDDLLVDFGRYPSLCEEDSFLLNVKKTTEIKPSNLIELTFNDGLHIGVIISATEYIHATKNQGVRISDLKYAPIKAIYEVI